MTATAAYDLDRKMDRQELEAKIGQILNRHPAVGLAVGVVRNGRLDYFRGHGVANVATGRPITEDTVFRIASISKTFTAIAVMQLYEQGLVDLDAPANDYLRAFKLVPAKKSFRPATLRHLLTHTAGLPEMVNPARTLRYMFDETYALDEPMPTLGEYYHGALRVNVEPGTRYTYTNHSFSALGQVVEDVTGERLDRYMRARIFEPLGMHTTDLARSERVTTNLATGYAFGSRGPKRVTDRQGLTAAASMVYSSPRDMALYLAALMGGGANAEGSILKPATMAEMFACHYTPDPRIAGMGLGFSRAFVGELLAIEHEGVLPGFNSQIFVAPNDGIGVMAFTNGSRQAMFWLPAATAGLLSSLLGVAEAGIRSDVPHHPEVWAGLCGWYPFEGPLTDMRARSIFGAGVQVFVRKGRLMFRALNPVPMMYRGFVLHPDDASDSRVFRFDMSSLGIESGRIIFARDPRSGRMRMHFDLLPMSLTRKDSEGGRRAWIARGLGAIAAVAAATAFLRRRRGRHKVA